MTAITWAVEPFSEVFDELIPLLHLHYGEISTHKDHEQPLDPRIESYRACEADGSLMLMIGRDAGQIEAYFVCFIAPGLHYRKCLTCTPDIFYVRPGRRAAGIGIHMFKEVEQELRRRGVKRWAVGCKVEHDASALFKRMGFDPVEAIWEKWL